VQQAVAAGMADAFSLHLAELPEPLAALLRG
jgi:hypothetical protein